jgi:hypothetical protein
MTDPLDAIFVPTNAECFPPGVLRIVELARNAIADAIRQIEARKLDAVIVVANEGAGSVSVRLVFRAALLAVPGGTTEARAQLAQAAPPRCYHCLVIPAAGVDAGICCMLTGEPMTRGGQA